MNTQQTLKMSDAVKSSNKNGYEIRADMLQLAKDIVQFEYRTAVSKIEALNGKDPNTNKVTTGETQWPDEPSVETILITAQKLYDFVNKR